MVTVEADGGVGPLAADRIAPEDGQAEVGEEGDRRFEVADGDANILKFDGHAWHAIELRGSFSPWTAAFLIRWAG